MKHGISLYPHRAQTARLRRAPLPFLFPFLTLHAATSFAQTGRCASMVEQKLGDVAQSSSRASSIRDGQRKEQEALPMSEPTRFPTCATHSHPNVCRNKRMTTCTAERSDVEANRQYRCLPVEKEEEGAQRSDISFGGRNEPNL